MKDEEMAEEYAEKHSFRVPYDGSNKFYDDTDFKASKDGFLEGLKAGRPQWHKVADGDLPTDDNQYLVLFYYNYKGKKEMVYGIRDNLHRDFEIHSNYTEQIIAWCEIPTFDKE